MIVVREATLDDAEMISNFQLAMAMETESFALDKTTVLKGVKAVFDDTGKGKYFVAEKDSVVAGSLMITCEWSDWRNKAVWWIQSVYVVPRLRGEKVFSRMYHYVKALVENDKEVAGLRLYVDLNNNNAREVYKALGMNGEHYQLFGGMKEG